MFKILINIFKFLKYKKKQAIFYIHFNEDDRFNKSDVENHNLLFGSTGKGKSFFIDKKELERLEKEKQKKKINKILDDF